MARITFFDKTGREVDVISVVGELNEGATVQEAMYIDNGDELSDEMYEYITDMYQEELYQDWYENSAENAFDVMDGLEEES